MKKILSIILILAMLLPTFAMAATPEDILTASVKSGDQLRTDVKVEINPALASMFGGSKRTSAIIDLVNVLGISFAMPTDQNPGELLLSVSDHPFVSIDGKLINNDLYLASNLLNNSLIVPLSKLTESLQGMMGDFSMDSLVGSMDTAKLQEIVMSIVAKATVLTDFAQPEGAIPVDSCIAIDLTMDDIITLESEILDMYMSMPFFSAVLSYSGMDANQMKAEMDSAFSEIRTQLGDTVIPVRVYLAGEEFAAMTMEGSMAAGDEAVALNMTILVTDNTADHQAVTVYYGIAANSTLVELQGDVDETADVTSVVIALALNGAEQGSLSFLQNRIYGDDAAVRTNSLVLTVPSMLTASITADVVAEVATGKTLTVAASLNDTTLATLTAAQYGIAPIASVPVEGALDVTAISEEQISTLSQAAVMNLLTALGEVSSYLPASFGDLMGN